ncbi:MAG: B12-binding domain-containing protein [Chloroflexi bacterium]|nr:B12-binding domain-containing protein [Chloroflexota bacterium]
MTEEINIKEMSIEEIIELVYDDLYDGLADEIIASVKELLTRNMTPQEIMNQGLVGGMDIVGKDFGEGILFVPEVLMAAKAMKSGMSILQPLLSEAEIPRAGTIVIGTVKGDIHDIGKNLVAMMMEGAGFKVVDLGNNVPVEKYLAAIDEHQPDFLGMSALLTTTMPYMRVVIEKLRENKIRDQVTVLVGGAPVTDAFAEDIRADAYCRNAAVAVQTAKKFIALQK